MDCRQFESCIPAYIDGEMAPEELQEFLAHAASCPDCYEELEIHYTVMQGLKALDSEEGRISGKDALSLADSLELAHDRIGRWTFGRVLKYALNTVTFWSILVILWFQIIRWVR